MNAQQLKNSILQEAIEGRLVPQDPNDEPASVLLERIRKEKARLVKEGKLRKKDLEEKPISEDEIPFEIPESWEWVRISAYTSKVTDFVASGSFASLRENVKYYNNKEYAILVRTKDFQTGFKSDLVYTDKHGYEFLENSNLFGGEVILPNIGASIGKVFIVPKLDYRMTLAPNTVMIRFVEDFQRDWVYILFLSKFGKNLLYDISSSTAQGKFNKTDFKELVIPIPPLAEQKRIVEKIEELLPKVEEYGKAQESLDKLNEELPERLKKSILQEAIEGRLVPQDPNDEPASVLLDKIRAEKKKLVKEEKLKKKDLEEKPISEDEIPFKIPQSWEWCRLGEISTYSHTKKKINASQAAINIWGLDLEDIEKGGKLLCIKSVGERKAIGDKTCFEEGDILYSKLRPYLLKILIAPQGGICTPEIIPFTCYGNICKGYIVNLLKSVYVDSYINSATFGIKMPRVATETMASLVIPLPPLAEQHRIVQKIEQLLKEIDKLKR